MAMSSHQQRATRVALTSCQGGACHFCGRPVFEPDPADRQRAATDPSRATLYRVVPKSGGGTNSLDNFVVACFGCADARAKAVSAGKRRSMRAARR